MDITRQPLTACPICEGVRTIRNASEISFEYSNVWWAVVCLNCGHITLHLMEQQRLALLRKIQKEQEKAVHKQPRKEKGSLS